LISSGWLILGSDLLVKQVSLSDGLSFDACAFEQDGLTSAEIDVSRRQIIQALMVAPVIVLIDERCDLRLQITGWVIVLQQDAVCEGLVPALDLALGLGMIGRLTDVAHSREIAVI
jgi:hypothetical protein